MDKHLPKIDDIKHRVKGIDHNLYREVISQKSTILKQELCSLFSSLLVSI